MTSAWRYLVPASAAILLILAGCPQPGGKAPAQASLPGATGGAQATKGGSKPTPPGPAVDTSNLPTAGTSAGSFELAGLKLGQGYASVKAALPAGWQVSTTWAAGAEEQTGVINATQQLKAPDPKKHIVTPPEIRRYAFFEGKLAGLLVAQPDTAPDAFQKWVADNTAALGQPGNKLPAFGEKCDMLAGLRVTVEGQTVQIWSSEERKEVLAATYSKLGSMATYYLAKPDEYTKSMLAIVNSPPPPPAPAGK
jgi:hypothetical protein